MPSALSPHSSSLCTRSAVLFLLGLLPATLFGQATGAGDSTSSRLALALGFRTLRATRIDGPSPVLDGRLDDSAWAAASIASDFVEQSPRPGLLPQFRTEVRVLYDDRALYLGIRAFDDHPDSIIAPYPRRDDETRSDWIFVEIDSRHDRRTGFGFGVNPRGVQVDATFDQYINYDSAWDGVWEAVPQIDSLGWSVEYRIPFSQLAWTAPSGEQLVFGLNVYRHNARTGESSDWSPRLPEWADLVSHFNDLTGIEPPHGAERLELVPYSAMKGTFAPAATGDPLADPSVGNAYAGLDVRARLAPGFTATAAIRPDFGQVEADPSQVNLTTFETFFPEQRPFFVQGESQFDFNLSLPFSTRDNSFLAEQPYYTRRIGRPPHGDLPAGALFGDIPTSTTLLGALKLSGRSSSGWSVGAMGALTDNVDARYVDGSGARKIIPVEPVTEYGVARVSRQSRDGGSYAGAIATAVNRSDVAPALDSTMTRRAYGLGFDGRHRFGNGNWEVRGFAMASRIEGSAAAITRVLHGPGHFYQRPDAAHLVDDTTRSVLSGIAAQARLARVGGAFRWGLVGHLISPGFEVNDLGFQRNADWLLATGWLSWERYPRTGWIRHWLVGSDHFGAGWSLGGERRSTVANGYANLDLRNYWGGALAVTEELPALATELLRGGPALMLPSRTSFNESMYTDGRHPMQFTLSASQSVEPGSGSHWFEVSPAVTWRATDRLALSLGPDITRTVSGWQYVDQPRETAAPNSAHYVMGRLDQTTVSLTSRADFAFSRNMTLQLYAQPFLSAGAYTQFKEVRDPRAKRTADRVVPFAANRIGYDPIARQYRVDRDGDGVADFAFANPDFNRKSFNLNLVWRWEYRPGSTLYLVWTQARDVGGTNGRVALGRDLDALFKGPATEVLLAKVSYRLGV